MPLARRRALPHDPPLSIRTADATFFLTICCEPRGQNQLCDPELARQLFDSVAFYNASGHWWVEFALLMPDHLHMLASFPSTAVSEKPPHQTTPGRARSPNAPHRSSTMAGAVAAWKRYTARQCGLHWQRDFFDHRLRGDESLRDKEQYIRQNPVRAGLVKDANEWPYVWWPEREIR